MIHTEDWRPGFDERFPIYRQIIGRFCRAVARGELIPGERIPSIRELSAALRVNANTIQRSYQEMEHDKIIFSQRGTGYYIMENDNLAARLRDEMAGESVSRFLGEMKELGFDEGRIIEEIRKCMANREQKGGA